MIRRSVDHQAAAIFDSGEVYIGISIDKMAPGTFIIVGLVDQKNRISVHTVGVIGWRLSVLLVVRIIVTHVRIYNHNVTLFVK